MHSWIRIASRGGLVAAMTVYASASAFAAQPAREMRRLAVTVYDYSGIEPQTLEYAERIVSDVYGRAGIEIEWAEPEIIAEPTRLYVNLLSTEMAGPFSASKETVGFATPGSLAANAIYDRICALARGQRLRCGLLLGYVMAHELGHLLLPAHSHSETGLMRANIDVELAADKKLRFTSDQAALMLERLTVAPALSTH
jgi:hypothetical protein